MVNYYIQGSEGWPFGLNALSVSGQLFPSQSDSNLFIGYFGFPTNPIEKGYSFRVWEGLNTNLNIWYGAGLNDIAILRSQYGFIPFGVDANSQVTAKITFNKNTKAYTRAGTPGTTSVNFISNNSSVIGNSISSQNSALINVYYNGWHWEKDFTFNTTSTINYKIVLGGGSQYGDNNLDGIATLGENFIPLNVVAGNTYRFRAKVFTANLSGPLPTLEYEVICLTCPIQKQNQLISTPLDIYDKITIDPPFSLQAATTSNLKLFYSTSSSLFTLSEEGIISLAGLTGSGLVTIYQPGNEQWFPASKNVTINIENFSGSCINLCLNTGVLYFTDDTYINLYNETGSGLFLENQINDNNLILSNESWRDFYSDFTGYGLDGFSDVNAGIILNINDETKTKNQNKFRVNYGVNESRNIVGNYHKQLISIRPQQPKNIGYLGYKANDNAWATYDVSTGMITGSLIPNNIFSYAIEITASGVLTGNNFYYTGNIDISTETGLAYLVNLQKNPELYTKNISVFDTINFNVVQDFCDKVNKCEPPPELDPIDLCYTGELNSTEEFQLFLSGFVEIANTIVINRPKTNNLLILPSTGTGVKYANSIYSGYILYNNWQSGDYIKWNLYNFNFTDLYQKFHLGNFPPYPNTGFILYYPNDFNSLDSLVDRLNEKIDLFKTYPAWYPYECLKDTASGIFLTGELMKFYKNTGTTGSLPINHFNNRIDFISLNSYPQLENEKDISQEISIFSSKVIQKDFFSGWSYLIPDNIQLEGYNKNTQNWEVLDIKNNLFEDLNKAKRIKKPIRKVPGVGEEEEEEEEQLPEEQEPPPGPSGCKDVIFEDQQRNVNFNENPLCPPVINFRSIVVTVPKEECKGKTVDANGNIVQKRSNQELCGDGSSKGGEEEAPSEDFGLGGEKPVGEYYIIRTGWNFVIDNLDAQINGVNNNQNINTNKIYDKYKVSLSNFTSVTEDTLFPKDSFFIKGINLYSLDKSGFDIHKGSPLCSIGSDYIVDVSGVVPIEISGIWRQNILPESSGIYRFFKTPFVRKIEENERLVKFNKVSGKIISPTGTGFLSTSGFGVGPIYYENNDYYFYNPSTQFVYFTETLTGLATGFGRLSGETIVIKQNVINQELLFGGRLANSNLVYHEILSNGNFVSEIENVEYIKYDILGFYPITGKVTGNTVNGKLDIDDAIVVTGSPIGNIYAYDPIPTGFTFSKVLFNINYNLLNNFDFLSLNGNTIIYHPDSSFYSPPTYFNSNETLISIINASSDIFLCTGEVLGSNIQLYSNLKGESGNINLTSNSTGLEIINFISGLNIYPRLYKIVTERSKNCVDDDPNCTFSFTKKIKDPIMTGNLGDSILATGFYYSSNGSGNITGNVPTFTGIRNFTDVWDIATGNLTRNYLSFLQNNFISGNSFYKNTLFGTAPQNVNLRVFYLNYLNTSNQEEVDVVDLIVKDLNNPSLSESGIVFRLNGIK
jgi:hypothetical protein